jgi:hypothetical protein
MEVQPLSDFFDNRNLMKFFVAKKAGDSLLIPSTNTHPYGRERYQKRKAQYN